MPQIRHVTAHGHIIPIAS